MSLSWNVWDKFNNLTKYNYKHCIIQSEIKKKKGVLALEGF